MEFSNNQLKLTAIIPVLNIFVAFVIAQKKKEC
jgi:hypothetical protein